jgi:exopolysaccharide biosynthesis polyprenyl glycosylphosphotransferase
LILSKFHLRINLLIQGLNTAMTLRFRQIFLIFGDIFLLYLSLLITLVIGFWKNFSWETFLEHLLPFSILYFFWLVIFYIFGFYDLGSFRTPFAFYARIITGLGICLALGVIFFYLIPFFGITPKTNLLLNAVILGILLLGWRKIFSSLFSAYFQTKVAIIGQTIQSEELSQIIQKNPHLGYKFIAFFNPEKDILQQARGNEIDTLILAENLIPDSHLAQNLYQCLPLKLNFIDLAKAYEIICEKIPITFVAQGWFLENLREREKGFYDKIRRIIDVFSASFFLLLTLPLWPFILIAIKLENRGPIFYSQKRVGKNKKDFLLIKFRSMKEGAEKETGAVWAGKEDSRITKVGKFLRRTHLDEIPQLINILKGDISLVGPRPERPEFVEELEKEIPHYHIRHLIKPGFTGWAQIKFRYGRSLMDSFEKLQYDLYYLKNRSLFLDLRILLKTFQLFFKKE